MSFSQSACSRIASSPSVGEARPAKDHIHIVEKHCGQSRSGWIDPIRPSFRNCIDAFQSLHHRFALSGARAWITGRAARHYSWRLLSGWPGGAMQAPGRGPMLAPRFAGRSLRCISGRSKLPPAQSTRRPMAPRRCPKKGCRPHDCGDLRKLLPNDEYRTWHSGTTCPALEPRKYVRIAAGAELIDQICVERLRFLKHLADRSPLAHRR